MKKYISYIGLMLVGLILFSCNKDSFDYKPGYVGSSKITNYAVFTITGGAYASVVKGSAYTDAGATAKQGTADLPVTTSGTVNTNQVGLYLVTYSAVNSDGFPATATRYVAVIPSAEQAGVDISGGYTYAAGGTDSQITKLAPGFYQTSNLWSVATTIPAYLITSDGQNIIIPLQATGFGRMQGTGVLAGTTSGSTLNYTVDLLDQGIAGSVRKWKRK